MGPSWSSGSETFLLWVCVALKSPNLIWVPFFLRTYNLRKSRALPGSACSGPDSAGVQEASRQLPCAGRRSRRPLLGLGPPQDMSLSCTQDVIPCRCSIMGLIQEEEGAAHTPTPTGERRIPPKAVCLSSSALGAGVVLLSKPNTPGPDPFIP